MIYEVPPPSDPIQQGDIFKGIPRIDINLASLSLLEEGEQLETTWQDILADEALPQRVTAVLPVKPVLAIVITQNCDAIRSSVLSLCEIGDYLMEGEKATPPKNPKGWQSKIVKGMIEQPKFFYLPAEPPVGIADRKAVDFRSVLRVLRTDLEGIRDHRLGRLMQVADEHFRETLAQFFRRYPVNAWYPLTKEEFQAYAESQKGETIPPYPWQE